MFAAQVGDEIAIAGLQGFEQIMMILLRFLDGRNAFAQANIRIEAVVHATENPAEMRALGAGEEALMEYPVQVIERRHIQRRLNGNPVQLREDIADLRKIPVSPLPGSQIPGACLHHGSDVEKLLDFLRIEQRDEVAAPRTQDDEAFCVEPPQSLPKG
ncbi:MAG: hypothetical protein JWQ58_534 [Reyranella sp.]|nr:hypothetical protein [Reyranella sp.]